MTTVQRGVLQPPLGHDCQTGVGGGGPRRCQALSSRNLPPMKGLHTLDWGAPGCDSQVPAMSPLPHAASVHFSQRVLL